MSIDLDKLKKLAIEDSEFGPYSWSTRHMFNVCGRTKEYEAHLVRYGQDTNSSVILALIAEIDYLKENREALEYKGTQLQSENTKLREDLKIAVDALCWYQVYADEIVLEHHNGKEKKKSVVAKEALSKIKTREGDSK
jgi:hypothetical protein